MCAAVTVSLIKPLPLLIVTVLTCDNILPFPGLNPGRQGRSPSVYLLKYSCSQFPVRLSDYLLRTLTLLHGLKFVIQAWSSLCGACLLYCLSRRFIISSLPSPSACSYWSSLLRLILETWIRTSVRRPAILIGFSFASVTVHSGGIVFHSANGRLFYHYIIYLS
jgi:hypothetical protein